MVTGHPTSGGKSLFSGWKGGGGGSLLNFQQNFQIADNPLPPFALEKAVFGPRLGQNFRKLHISNALNNANH